MSACGFTWAVNTPEPGWRSPIFGWAIEGRGPGDQLVKARPDQYGRVRCVSGDNAPDLSECSRALRAAADRVRESSNASKTGRYGARSSEARRLFCVAMLEYLNAEHA